MGCPKCHKGFSGRTGIFQVMPMSTEMQQLVLQEAGIQEMDRQARQEGISSLRIAGMRKVLQGVTSLSEVLAATRDGT
jgi:type IV pilus assembly protein PilB